MNEADLQRARATVERLFAAALAAVDPSHAVCRAVAWRRANLSVAGVRLPTSNGVHVVAFGKAAAAMTRGALQQLGDVIISGDVITKDGHGTSDLPPRIVI